MRDEVPSGKQPPGWRHGELKNKSSMLRSLLKRGVRTARSWVENPIATERQRWGKFAYSELNVMLLQLLAAKGDLRPNYTWGVLHAAYLAKALGIKRISAIEFGVAGGRGLISLEKTAEAMEESLGIAVDVYGFDTGHGLPKPEDYRDLPDLYEANTYPMDQEALRRQLHRANLVIGLIGSTLPDFIASRPSPVGFVSIDVDLYSSTMDAFKLFDANHSILLPRIYCYFDDIMGFTFSEFTGERLAIEDFNNANALRKISPIFGLRHFVPRQFSNDMWVESMYLAHFFDHPLCGSDGRLVIQKQENLENVG
jgi:hypothetical protein